MDQIINHEGRFAGYGGLSLYYQSWAPLDAPTHGVVLIVHGIGEHSSAYGNVVEQLAPAGFVLYGFDLRGHGRSPGRRGYITSWNDYRQDLRAFVRFVREQQPRQPLFLLGHSLGGVIILDYALHFPGGLSGVVAIGPAIGRIGISPARMALARLVSRIWPSFSMPTGLDVSAISRDPQVVVEYQADPLVHDIGTARLAAETERAVNWVQAHAAELRVPLLIQHGGADRLALPDGSRRFVAKVATPDKELREYPAAFHQLHNETCHKEVTDDMVAWIERNLSRDQAVYHSSIDTNTNYASPGTIAPWISPLVAVRYAADGRGHYESFYIKANHPTRKLALWLKFNLLEPTGHPERLQGELWGVWFDGEQGRHIVAQQVMPRDAVEAQRSALNLRLGNARLELLEDVLVEHAQVADSSHMMAWDVQLRPEPYAPPALLFPARRLYEGGLPRKKVLTPIPRGRLDGWIEVDGARHELDGWEGLHGHNWGREHTFRYAYGNGLFPNGAYVDGFSARLKIGPIVSPWISLLLVRLPDGRELPFNGLVRWLAGRPRVGNLRWKLDLPGPHGTRARLVMSSGPEDAVGLRYRYPDGRSGLCINTKFGHGRLRVEERDRILYEGVSERCELEIFGS